MDRGRAAAPDLGGRARAPLTSHATHLIARVTSAPGCTTGAPFLSILATVRLPLILVAAAVLGPALAFAHELPGPHAHVDSAPSLPLGGIAFVVVTAVSMVLRARMLLRARAA